MRQLLNIVLLTLIFSFNTAETVQEEKSINDILFSIITDNPDLFKSDCKLLEKYSDRFMPPSRVCYNDSTFIKSIRGFFDEREFDNLLRQKRNHENYGFVTTDFKSKYQLISEAEIDSVIQKVQKDKHLDYWTEFTNKIGCLQCFSRPIISSDKNTVIIKYMALIGPTTASGFILIFQKRNDKWIVAKEIDGWVS